MRGLPPFTNTVYAPFDPCISIGGQLMKFIVNPAEKDSFKANHFKFLGRWINPLLQEKELKSKILSSFLEDIEIIKNSKVNGFMKLWLYQFYALSHLSWPFIINDLDRSFSLDLQREVNVQLKCWAGIGRSVDNGLLFRSKMKFGLGLTSVSDHYQRMQIIKYELLRNSLDPTVVELYKFRELQNNNFTKIWKATKALSIANAEVDLALKFPAQSTKQGLGFGKYNAQPSQSERRKLVTSKAHEIAQESLMTHTHSLKRQSVWLEWAETTYPFDFSWKNLIWGGISTDVFKFVLNSSVNWVRTPDLLHLWGYKKSCSCCLCGAEKCTLHHILSNCIFSLNDKRFTWRHDSVLSLIYSAFKEHIESLHNTRVVDKNISIAFVKAGSTKINKKFSTESAKQNLLSKGNDWKILADLPNENFVFPPEIFSSAERPDILIWSDKLKTVILLELTCPAEEGIQAAQLRKQSRYMPLVQNISQHTPWKPLLLTVEVGVRGFVAISTHQVFLKLGLPGKKVTSLCKKLSTTAAKCSYTIYLSANSKNWDHNRPLLDSLYVY